MLALRVPKGTGEIVGNFLRQLAVAVSPSYRLVGFKTNSSSTSVSTNKISTAFELTQKLHLIDFTVDGEEDFVSKSFQYRGNLTLDHFNDGIVATYKDTPYVNSIPNIKESIILADSGDGSITLYFRKASGVHSIDDNKQFLEQKLGDIKHVTSMSSNHSRISSCRYEVVSDTGETDILNFSINNGTEPEELLYREVCNSGIALLSNIKTII